MSVAERGWRIGARATVLACLATLVAWPLGRLVAEGVGGSLGRLVADMGATGAGAVVNSLWISVVVTMFALVVGTAAAVLTERMAVRGRGALRAAILAPLIIPDFVSAMSWERAYGPVGLSHRLLGVSLPGLVGPAGIVIVLSVGAVPLAYLVIVGGMRVRAEPDLERAARASGAGAWTAFRTITLPLLAPVLTAAAGLVFVTTMNAFGTPAVLGRPAGFGTMTTRIYQDLAFSSSDEAFRRVISLSVLMVVVAMVVVGAVDRISARPMARTGAGGGVPGNANTRRPVRTAGRWWPGVVAWLAVLAVVVVPLLALLLAALTRAVGLAPVPGNWTLANFGRALNPEALGDLGNSLALAAATAVLAVTLGLVAMAAGDRCRARLGTAVTLAFAIPGSVVAVGMLLAFGPALRDTLAIIGIAYLAKLWALGQRPIGGAVDRLPRDLQRAARASGAGLLTGLRTITLPLLAPAIGAGALLVFVFALHEVTISILLYGPRTATLAVSILNLQQVGDPVLTAALAVVLTSIVAALTGLLLLVVRRWPWAGGALG